jgi:hypothetical protein
MATSPYLIREARRLKIDTPAVREPLPGSTAPHRRRDYRFARTQQEAGIEGLEWERRLKPLRPWLFNIAAGACWMIFALAIIWIMARCAGAPDLQTEGRGFTPSSGTAPAVRTPNSPA